MVNEMNHVVYMQNEKLCNNKSINCCIQLHEKFLQFDWLRAVVFHINLKYLHVKITNLLQVAVCIGNSMICSDINYHE